VHLNTGMAQSVLFVCKLGYRIQTQLCAAISFVVELRELTLNAKMASKLLKQILFTAFLMICVSFSSATENIVESNEPIPNQSTIFSAAEGGDVATVRDLLRHNSEMANVQNGAGWTPLIFAVANGHIDLAEELLQHGADPNLAEYDGWTPIMFASFQNNEPLVAMIMQSGGSPLYRNRDDLSAHELANSQSHFALADYLGEEAVYYAMANEDLNEMLRHVRQGVSANVQNGAGWSPLMFASSYGSFEAVEELIYLGAEVNAFENDGWTALMFAANNGHADVAAHLIEKGADVNAAAKDGRSVLQIAKTAEAAEVVKLLIDAGATTAEASAEAPEAAIEVPVTADASADEKKGKNGLFGSLFGD